MEVRRMQFGGRKTVHSKPITMVFLRFVGLYTAGALFWLFAAVMIFYILDAAGEVLPANHMEIQLNASADDIRSVSEVTEELIPEGCSYGVYADTGNWLYGTFPKEERGQAWECYETSSIYAPGKGYYRFFVRDAKEICIVKYKIMTRFRNPYLSRILPRPDLLMVVFFVVLFLLHTAVVSRYFGKYMRTRLRILREVTEKIRCEDLEFAEEHSEIREVDEILSSLHQMKEALKASLYRQWDVERGKDEQIAALAHDIKTPLTVIRGNAELLAEGELAAEEKEYNRDILQSAATMETYLGILNEILLPGSERTGEEERSGEQEGGAGGSEKTACDELAGKLAEQARRLLSARQYPALFCKEELHGELRYNEIQILRAWSNILGNAMDHSPADGKIEVSFKILEGGEEKYLAAAVEDEGPGFSKQDLLHATEQFYQGDQSRNSRTHYGIGLHIAEKFVQRQGGKLVIENREVMGARVMILLKMEK